MMDPPAAAAPEFQAAFRGHVLHLVDQAVAARWLPMLRQVIWAQAESGIPVTLITNDIELLDSLDHAALRRLHTPRLGGWQGWPLAGLLDRLAPPPDVIQLWGVAGLFWVQRYALGRGIPVIVYAFGESDLQRLASRGPKSNAQVAVASRLLAEPLSQRKPLAVGRWQSVPPAVALPLHRPLSDTEGRTLGLLCVGCLQPGSGMETLAGAIAQLRRKSLDVQAVLIGDGGDTGNAWRHIRQHDIQGRCSLIDEPRLWERGVLGADVCVVPGCQRDLWLAPLMAMGLGKLVITSRDQLAEWFIDEHTTWQFTPGSAVELAYLLERAIEQPRHARETGRTAAEYFDEHHSVGNLVERLLTMYRNTTAGGLADPLDREESTFG